MKKQWIGISAVFLLTGCTQTEPPTVEESPVPSITAETIIPEETDSSLPDVIAMEHFYADSVESFLLNGNDWEYDFLTLNITEENSDPFGCGYGGDAVFVKQDGLYGIYNYEGEMLLEFQAVNIANIQHAIVVSKGEETVWYLVSKDYQSVDYSKQYIAGYEGLPMYIKDGRVYSAYGDEEITGKTGNASDYYLLRKQDGTCGVCDGSYQVISEMDGYACSKNVFSNGYVFLSDTPCSYTSDETGKIHTHGSFALYNGITGEAITDYIYEDAGYLRDGVAPVKTDGKWGYINAEGNTVIDFIFEEASSLYNQRAYVKYNGQWYNVNINNLLLNSSDMESLLLDASYEKATQDTGGIGKVTVLVDKLNIRAGSSVETEKNGTAVNGKTYDVFEIKKNEEYTWYRIGDNRWIADNGTWCNYQEN